MTLEFTVFGSSVDELRQAAEAVVADAAPGRSATFKSFHARAIQTTTGRVATWTAEVEVVVAHGSEETDA